MRPSTTVLALLLSLGAHAKESEDTTLNIDPPSCVQICMLEGADPMECEEACIQIAAIPRGAESLPCPAARRGHVARKAMP